MGLQDRIDFARRQAQRDAQTVTDLAATVRESFTSDAMPRGRDDSGNAKGDSRTRGVYVSEEQDITREETDASDIQAYRNLAKTHFLIRESFETYVGEVMEPGYDIGADSDETARELSNWADTCAIVGGLYGQDLRLMLEQALHEQLITGSAPIEHVGTADEPMSLAAIKLLRTETLQAYKLPDKNVLVRPFDEFESDDEYPRVDREKDLRGDDAEYTPKRKYRAKERAAPDDDAGEPTPRSSGGGPPRNGNMGSLFDTADERSTEPGLPQNASSSAGADGDQPHDRRRPSDGEELAAFVQYDDELDDWWNNTSSGIGGDRDEEDEEEVGFALDEITLLTHGRETGTVFGISAIAPVKERAEAMIDKYENIDQAVKTMAYPHRAVFFGDESGDYPWDYETEIEPAMREWEPGNFEPGQSEGLPSDVNIEEYGGEVPKELGDLIQNDVNAIMAAMPVPKYELGAFEMDINQFVSRSQENKHNLAIRNARRRLESEITPLLKQKAEDMGLDSEGVGLIIRPDQPAGGAAGMGMGMVGGQAGENPGQRPPDQPPAAPGGQSAAGEQGAQAGQAGGQADGPSTLLGGPPARQQGDLRPRETVTDHAPEREGRTDEPITHGSVFDAPEAYATAANEHIDGTAD